MAKIEGAFEANMSPTEAGFTGRDGIQIGRFALDKTYHGALSARGVGDMLSARTAVETSAGYVAIEQVTGELDGRSGSFVLQHTGLMGPDGPSLSIAVVPDSGTGDLTGLRGQMDILIEDGAHRYVFEYSLPD